MGWLFSQPSSRQIERLKNKIFIARKELEQAWEASGKTDSAVLSAGEKVDMLLNEYSRLINKTSCKN
jgi:hypothetical protein